MFVMISHTKLCIKCSVLYPSFYLTIVLVLSLLYTLKLCKSRTTFHCLPLAVVVCDCPSPDLHGDHAPPVHPLSVQDVAGDKSEEEIEYGHHCTEL